MSAEGGMHGFGQLGIRSINPEAAINGDRAPVQGQRRILDTQRFLRIFTRRTHIRQRDPERTAVRPVKTHRIAPCVKPIAAGGRSLINRQPQRTGEISVKPGNVPGRQCCQKCRHRECPSALGIGGVETGQIDSERPRKPADRQFCIAGRAPVQTHRRGPTVKPGTDFARQPEPPPGIKPRGKTEQDGEGDEKTTAAGERSFDDMIVDAGII